MWVVMSVVLLSAYAVLSLLGVIDSVSQALSVVSGSDVQVLEVQNVVPGVLALSAVIGAIWFACAMGAVLVHNAVTEVTGGLRVRAPRQSIATSSLPNRYASPGHRADT
jgi:hypothetical protein